MNIIVVGCENVGAIVATELANLNHNITLIESDQDKLQKLGSGFNGRTITGVEYDQEILVLSGIETTDVLLALTDNDNLNITVSLIASSIFKVKKVVSQVNDPSRRDLFDLLSIETISPTKMAVNSLLSKMDIVPIETVYKITTGFEITQIHVQRELPIKVSDLCHKVEVLISVIISNGIAELVHNNSEIKNNDVVVCTHHIRDRRKVLNLLVQENV